MDTAPQWPHQEIVVKPMDEIIVTSSTCPKPSLSSSSSERKSVRPQKEQAINCPRCNSTNTKFCYYNNYSLSQPRYFCKTCRRYWTEGGSLRNIPVGGGSRKNKRSSSSSSAMNPASNNSSSKKLPDLVPQQNPNKNILETQDLNLGFAIHHQDLKAITEMIQVPNFDQNNTKLELHQNPSSSANSSHHHHLLQAGLNSFMMPLPVVTSGTDHPIYTSGFSLPDQFKTPSLNFSLDGGLGSNYGSFQGVQEANGKLLFPFEDLKQVNSSNNNITNDAEQNRDHHHQHGADSTGYWNGVMGGGSW